MTIICQSEKYWRRSRQNDSHQGKREKVSMTWYFATSAIVWVLNWANWSSKWQFSWILCLLNANKNQDFSWFPRDVEPSSNALKYEIQCGVCFTLVKQFLRAKWWITLFFVSFKRGICFSAVPSHICWWRKNWTFIVFLSASEREA